MTQAILIQVADAVASELNLGGFSVDFTAARIYDTELPLEHAGDLRVDVAPGDYTIVEADRAHVQLDVRADVAVRQRVNLARQADMDAAMNEAADALMKLEEEIARSLDGLSAGGVRRLTAMPTAVWLSTQVRAPYIPAHFRSLQQFTGIVAVTYRVYA